MDSFTYIHSKFGGRKSGDQYRGDCPECHKKRTLVWAERSPHPFTCKACGYAGNVFTIGYKTPGHDNNVQSELSLLERFLFNRKRKFGNNHRLSDRVIAHFGLYAANGHTAAGKPRIELRFPNADGETVKLLTSFQKPWLSPKGGHKDFWLNTHRLADNPKGSAIFVCAGEWDLFALWEHTGVNGISPANGETSNPKNTDDLELFSGRNVVILYDNDTAGRKGGKQLARNILRHVKTKSVKVIDLAALGAAKAEGGSDLDDFFASGGKKERLREEVQLTPEFKSDSEPDAYKLVRALPEPLRRFPGNPSGVLDDVIVEAIWRAARFPENQRLAVYEALAREEGFSPEKPRLMQQRIAQYVRELEAILVKAFDEAIIDKLREIHLKAESKDSYLINRNYWFYNEGVYRPFTPDVETQLVDVLARELYPPDSRFGLSRYRKQIAEDLSHHKLALPEVKFDENKKVVNFKNGLYDLETSTFSEHTPEHLSRFQLDVSWDPSAECHEFKKALQIWFAEEDQRREFLKVLFYAISGDRSQHAAIFFYGAGDDGKGEAVKILISIIGKERTSSIGLEDLDKQFMPSMLYGKWLNIADEVGRKIQLNDAAFKRFTGGSQASVDVKHRDPISFVSHALWVVITNSLFVTPDNSRGFDRRLKFLNFSQVPQEKRILDYFDNYLKPELQGIIRYILTDGQLLYNTEKFRETLADKETKHEIRAGHSVSGYWLRVFDIFIEKLKEHVEKKTIIFSTDYPWHKIEGGAYVGCNYINAEEHYEKYKDFCKEQGNNPQSLVNFKRDTKNALSRIMNDVDTFPAARQGKTMIESVPIRIKKQGDEVSTLVRVYLCRFVKVKSLANTRNSEGEKIERTGSNDGELSHKSVTVEPITPSFEDFWGHA
jgi:putative DNA primase/helicase